MKNIEKKWALFLLATFVTFLGIGWTLIRGTEAKGDDLSEVNSNNIRGDIYEK